MKLAGLVPLILFLVSCSSTPSESEDVDSLFGSGFQGYEVTDIEVTVEATPDSCTGWGDDRDKYLCVVRENLPRLAGIYRKYKESNPDVNGGITAELEIAENGSVDRVRLHEIHFKQQSNVLRDQKLISILLEELKETQFVQLSQKSKFVLLLPFREFSELEGIDSESPR